MDNSQTFVDEPRLDALGSHFKFRDLTKRLNLVINEHRQEKRSKDLINYQIYFTSNEQPQKLYVGPRQKLMQAQRDETEAVAAVKLQQERQRKTDQIREPNVSIERQPQPKANQGSVKLSPAKAEDLQKIIGQSFTIQQQEDNYTSKPDKTMRADKISSRVALADKMIKPLDTRISLSNVANQIVSNRQPQSQAHVVNMNPNQLNLGVFDHSSQNGSNQSTVQKKQTYVQQLGHIPVQDKSRQSQQFVTQHHPTEVGHDESRNLRQRHNSMDEIQSDYKQMRPYHFAQQPNNHQSLSKMLGSQTRLQRNDLNKKVMDKYSTTQNFQHQLQSNPKRKFHQQAKGLTIDSSQSPSNLRFNIGQVRAASVMEQQSDEARLALDKQKRPRVQERLMPVSTTHGGGKFYESEYGNSSMMGQSTRGGQEIQGGTKKLPVKMQRASILPKV